MREAGVVLDDGGDGEGGGAAAARVDGDKGVADVLLGLAHVVGDLRRRPRDHRLDVLGREGLLRTVGGDAERLAQTMSQGVPVSACSTLEWVGMLAAHSMAGSSASNARTVSTFLELSHRGMDASLCLHFSGASVLRQSSVEYVG